MQKVRIWQGLLALILVSGCTGKDLRCGDKVSLLWPDAKGHYSFQDVQLSTLPSMYELKGEAAEVYYETGLDDSGFQGPPAEPHLMSSNGICVPQDVASSLALNSYAQFEKLYLFERQLGIASQLTWPRRVGVEIHLDAPVLDAQNNAHYYGNMDLITLVPYSLNFLPVGNNLGIVAHEHFHAHFQTEVLNKVNAQMPQILSLDEFFDPLLDRKPSVDDLGHTNLDSPRGLNNFVVRGWNEGLADFYGAIYTGRADFFEPSMPGRAAERNLDNPLEIMLSGENLALKLRNARARGAKDLVRGLTSVAYKQGTLLAGTLFRLAHSGVEDPHQFLKRIVLRLDQLPALLVPVYATKVLDVESILPVLLEGFPLNAAGCAAVLQVASDQIVAREFTSCSK